MAKKKFRERSRVIIAGLRENQLIIQSRRAGYQRERRYLPDDDGDVTAIARRRYGSTILQISSDILSS